MTFCSFCHTESICHSQVNTIQFQKESSKVIHTIIITKSEKRIIFFIITAMKDNNSISITTVSGIVKQNNEEFVYDHNNMQLPVLALLKWSKAIQ